MKPKDDARIESYSVRPRPDLITQVKHLAVDERKPVSLLIEEVITLLLQKHRKDR